MDETADLPNFVEIEDSVQESSPVSLGPYPTEAVVIPRVRAGGSGSAPRQANRRLVVVDGATVAIGLFLAGLVLAWSGTIALRSAPYLDVATPLALAAFAWHGMYRGNGVRAVPSGVPVWSALARSAPAVAISVAIAVVVAGVTDSPRVLVLAAAITLPLLGIVLCCRACLQLVRTRLLRARNQQVLIVGCGEAADLVASRMRRTGGIDVLGMVDESTPPGFETIGCVSDVPRLCDELGVDRIIVALPRAPWSLVSETLQPLIGTVDIAVVPSLYELMTWRSGIADVSGIPLVPLVAAQAGWVPRIAKRVLDVVVAAVTLVVLSPVLLAAAISIRATSKGPVIFRQRRAGLHDMTFTILKFRTMRVDAEEFRTDLMNQSNADGPRFKMERDPRVTRVGAFLRQYSIDELPQLFNVISGRMSLVGPRPFPLVESGAFHVGTAEARFEMKPGMTGLWQVSGRSDLSWDDLCRLDAIYVRSWSLAWDLRILAQTPLVALRRQGAY